MTLTDVAVRKAQASKQLSKLSRGGGPHFWIAPTGGKHWHLAYRRIETAQPRDKMPQPTPARFTLSISYISAGDILRVLRPLEAAGKLETTKGLRCGPLKL